MKRRNFLKGIAASAASLPFIAKAKPELPIPPKSNDRGKLLVKPEITYGTKPHTLTHITEPYTLTHVLDSDLIESISVTGVLDTTFNLRGDTFIKLNHFEFDYFEFDIVTTERLSIDGDKIILPMKALKEYNIIVPESKDYECKIIEIKTGHKWYLTLSTRLI